MGLPSHPRVRVSRSIALRVSCSAALLAVLALVPAAGAATIGAKGLKAAKGDRGVFVSKGVGRQIFAGGGGVAYGVVFSGASLVVVDYSATHDMKVDAPVIADRPTPTARAPTCLPAARRAWRSASRARSTASP